MRVIFTCGGTAGHVNPALALAGYMKEKAPETAVLFVGTPTGMERELVAKAGYDYAAVEVSSFQRKLNAAGIRHNLHTVRVLASSGRQARAILRQFRPDLVVGTGGYASYPMVKAAARAHLPTAVHESNMVPGLTTKLLENYASFEEAGVSGENLSQAKAKIEKTMDSIVAGFEHQLDELYRTDAMDIDSDIRVMETMLRRDTASVADDFGLSGSSAVQQRDE